MKLERISLTEEEFKKVFKDCCYTRKICDEAGAVYWRLNKEDKDNLKKYLFAQYFEIKK